MSKGLSQISRTNLNAMFFQMAKTYGVDSVDKQFAVEPTINQQLQDAIVESSEFLQLINVVGVQELKGEKILGGATAGPGRRTNTDIEDNFRKPQDLMTLGSKMYELFPTEFDYYIKYSTIDAWAKRPDLAKRYGEWMRKNIALARVMVGWHGLSAAVETDPTTYTNGEDLNVGWFQALRDYSAGSQVLTEGQTANIIQVGAGGDYENIDTLVLDTYSLINPIHQGRNDHVVILGREILTNAKASLYSAHGGTPTEKERMKIEEITKEFAGIPRIEKIPAFFPDRGLYVGPLSNLSIYHQESSWRRQVEENPKANRIDEFNSNNEGYVVEDEEACAMIEFANVQLKDSAGSWG